MGQPRDQPVDAEERQEIIRESLDHDGLVRVRNLADQFGVSEMTIRRDLEELERLGVLRRVRGGARPLGPRSFPERHRRNARAKALIAEKLLSLVPETGAIAFDASTTVLALASRMGGARRLAVVTNGIPVFQTLLALPGVRPVLTGGFNEPETGSLVGPVACHATRAFTYSRFFTSAASVDADLGATESACEEAEVKLLIGSATTETILAVDSSKLDRRSAARTFELADVSLMVTDLEPDDPRLDSYRERVELL